VLGVEPALAILPKLRLGIKPVELAVGYSIGVLMRLPPVAASALGEINTPPRPTPKVNSLTTVGPKFW